MDGLVILQSPSRNRKCPHWLPDIGDNLLASSRLRTASRMARSLVVEPFRLTRVVAGGAREARHVMTHVIDLAVHRPTAASTDSMWATGRGPTK